MRSQRLWIIQFIYYIYNINLLKKSLQIMQLM